MTKTPGLLALAAAATLAGPLLAQPSQPAEQPAGGEGAAAPAGSGARSSPPPLLRPGQPTAATEPGAMGDRGPWSIGFRANGNIAFDTNFDGQPGSVAIYRLDSGASVGYAISPRLRVGVDFSNTQSWYDFDQATGIIPGTADPFDQTSTYSLTPSVGFGVDENWSIRVAGLFDWSQEGSGPDSDGFTAGGLGVVRYRFSPELALSGGILVSSRLEEDTLFVPLIGVEWQITEVLRFETRGLGTEFSAKLNDRFTAFIDGSYSSRDFRLDEDNTLPEGLFRDRRALVGAGVRWTPAPFIEVSFRGGAVVWSEFRIDDRNGNELRTVDLDPTGYIGLNAELRF
jgi:hypothetical protein